MSKSSLPVAIGETWQPKLLPYLAVIVTGLIFITNILNLKFIDVFGYSVIAASALYTLSLIVGDIMTEVYGYRRTRKVLYAAFAMLGLYAVAIQLAVIAPPAASYANNAAFTAVFGSAPKLVALSLAAYLASELINSFIMSRLKIKFRARYFHARAVCSTVLANIVANIIFFGLGFIGVMPLSAMISASIASLAMTFVGEVIVVFFTGKIVKRIKAYEGVEHFDAQPAK